MAARSSRPSSRPVLSAEVLSIGTELTVGDTRDTNAGEIARWLSRRGVAVGRLSALPDDLAAVQSAFADSLGRADLVVSTGGLGPTPDDLTREAIATAFRVEQEEVPEVAADLRARFTRNPEYAARWALLPRASRPLANPHGGAPGFAIENVYVLPGLPSEMEAMFASIEEELRRGSPIQAWRRVYRTYESVIAETLAETAERWPGILVGSYPSFSTEGSTVEVVLKSSDADALAAASAWLAAAIEESGRR